MDGRGLQVITSRDRGDFTRTRRLGAARFEQAVRREITRRGGLKPCLRIVRGLFTALSDPAGVIAHRAGALERVQLLLEDWQLTRTRLTQAEQRMTGVLDELGLTAQVTSITGLSPVGAAAILAETGDLRRFATARALVKHAGLARGRNYPAPSPAGPGWPVRDAPGCAWQPGAPSGERSAPTPSTPPATST